MFIFLLLGETSLFLSVCLSLLPPSCLSNNAYLIIVYWGAEAVPLWPVLTAAQPHSHLFLQVPVFSSIRPLEAPCKLSVEMAPHWGLCSCSTAPLDTRWWGLASLLVPGMGASPTGLQKALYAKVTTPPPRCLSSAAGGLVSQGPHVRLH